MHSYDLFCQCKTGTLADTEKQSAREAEAALAVDAKETLYSLYATSPKKRL